MQQTLKEKNKQKRILEVQNKLKKIDNRLMESSVNFQVDLLLEALDENEYKEATEVIEKLKTLNDKAKEFKMENLATAIEVIIKNINEFTGGTALSRLGGKMSSLFSKTPAKNPILAGLAMVGTLETGFKLIPTILKNNIPDIEKDAAKQKQTIMDLIKDDKKLEKNVNDNLAKAFVPTGTFGKLFGKMPGLDMKLFMIDILGVTPEQLGVVSKILDTGAKVAEIDPKIADPKEAGGEAAGKSKTPTAQQQKQQIAAVATAAKDAGITEEETVVRFLSNVMDFKDGIKNPYADTAIQVLKDFAYNKSKIAKGQLDGFVDGLSIDHIKVKKQILDLVKAEEKKKKEEAAAKAAKGEPSAAAGASSAAGSGSQLGNAMGAS